MLSGFGGVGGGMGRGNEGYCEEWEERKGREELP